jgi:hypothetical protein
MSETPRREETARDSRLAALYRAAARDEPSPALDAAIRAAARREVGARPRPVGPFFSRSWRVPLSLAAVILLSVSLVTLMREEAPEIARPPRADAPLPLPEAATYPRKETVAADRTGASEPPTPLAKRASPEAFPGVSAGRDTRVTALADKPRQPAQAEVRRDVAAAPAVTWPQPEAARPAQSVEAVASAPAPLAAPAEAPGPVAGVAAEAKAQPRSEAASADSAVRESLRARGQAATAPAPQLAPQIAGVIQAHANLPPEKWLEQIEALRKQGRLEEAKTSLAHFRQRYPDYPLPAGLKDGIKP